MGELITPPEVFLTPRIEIRKPALTDAKQIFEGYAQDKLVTRFLTWQPHANINVTKRFLKDCLNHWKYGSAFPWVIVLRETEQVIGSIELRLNDHRADLGFGLAMNYWGQGIGTEAVKMVVDWTIAQPGIYRVWGVCDVDNLASARVLEKAGMQREGTLRRWLMRPTIDKAPRDCYVYSIVK